MDNSFIVWFSLIFFFLFLEMGHPGLLYFLTFSCGALCAFIATLYGVCVPYQLIIFIAGTCGALFFVHFFMMSKKNQLQVVSHRSNIDALIGKKVTVFRSVQDAQIWQVKILGQIWLVKSIHEQQLHEDQQVIIVDVQGCHLRVDTIK